MSYDPHLYLQDKHGDYLAHAFTLVLLKLELLENKVTITFWLKLFPVVYTIKNPTDSNLETSKESL